MAAGLSGNRTVCRLRSDRMARGVTEHARETPDRVALIAPDAAGGVDGVDVRRVGRAGPTAGCSPGGTRCQSGRPVASAVRNGLEPFEVATAAAMAGAPFLPLNWHLKSAELAYLLEDSGAAVVVGHHDVADQLPEPDRGGLARILIGGPDEATSYEALVAAAPTGTSARQRGRARARLLYVGDDRTAEGRSARRPRGSGSPSCRHERSGPTVGMGRRRCLRHVGPVLPRVARRMGSDRA